MHNPKTHEWMAHAPLALRSLLLRMTKHAKVNWVAEDYDDVAADRREIVDSLDQAEAVSSKVGDRPVMVLADGPSAAFGVTVPDASGARETLHCIAVDVDVPAFLVRSSTADHSHLYVSLVTSWDKYCDWLDASVKIGLLEEGYVNACKSRGMTSLRAPWIKKGHERDDFVEAGPTGPTPLTITESGGVYGHIAAPGRLTSRHVESCGRNHVGPCLPF